MPYEQDGGREKVRIGAGYVEKTASCATALLNIQYITYNLKWIILQIGIMSKSCEKKHRQKMREKDAKYLEREIAPDSASQQRRLYGYCVEWAGTAAYFDAVHVSEHGTGDRRLL